MKHHGFSAEPGHPMNRRRFLTGTAATVATGLLLPGNLWADATNAPAAVLPVNHRFKIGICDWMILKRQKLSAFQLTSDIGADGVELDMGSLGERETFNTRLNDPVIRQQFLDEAGKFKLEICSLAMSAFYGQSFAERPTVPRMVQDTIETMKLMNLKTAFLPLGVKSDLVKNPDLRPVIVQRLKAAAQQAEKAGVVIGIATALDAAGDVKLLDEIGSSAIRIYFNFATAIVAGRDICQELLTLGKNRLCQIHCTNEDGRWIQDDPAINLPKIKETLDSMGWSGWLVVERSRSTDDVHNVRWNYGHNAAHLKSIFQAK